MNYFEHKFFEQLAIGDGVGVSYTFRAEVGFVEVSDAGGQFAQRVVAGGGGIIADEVGMDLERSGCLFFVGELMVYHDFDEKAIE